VSIDTGNGEAAPNLTANGFPYPIFRTNWVDITPGAEVIVFTNSDAVNPWSGYLQFKLDLG
jgi:hypothetical protein